MPLIDKDTVQRILDTADIVDVVSDYVRLRRRGSGFIGLCPFHNERTPSFSVSKTKGMCKCFSCGKGGSPVGFIMEIEQVSYPEALRMLAKKYGIEIKERELSREEMQAASERESMLALNDYAMRYYENILTSTQQGRDIGLAYFRGRGINEAMIKKFHLGFSPEQRDAFCRDAIAHGYKEEFLEKTSLGIRGEHGDLRDRFRGRVMYPVLSLSGKVVAFGGRTLRTTKDVAKYVNSAESIIYSKSNELYGLYQAKPEIVRKDKCILVEGYMDVISMHQSGISNVVASSGTSLTEGQIRLIHRFTENVTVIYDSDPAGIKASLRGIDMLLAQGLKIHVLLLPEGDDPDSFAQAHSSQEVENYITDNETDFISFKTRILLQGLENDPIRRSAAITDIVGSIAVIPDMILRTEYITMCSRMLGVSETLLTAQVAKIIAENTEKAKAERIREANRRRAGIATESGDDTPSEPNGPKAETPRIDRPAGTSPVRSLQAYERDLLRYALKYGLAYMADFSENPDGTGELRPINVIEYIDYEMRRDNLTFTHEPYRRAFMRAMELGQGDWGADAERYKGVLEQNARASLQSGIEQIRAAGGALHELEQREKQLREQLAEEYQQELDQYAASYLARVLASDPDDEIRNIATELTGDKYVLSKIHTKFSHIESEQDRLATLVPMAIDNLKGAIIEERIAGLQQQLRQECAAAAPDFDRIRSMMEQQLQLDAMKKEIARTLGERTLAQPRR